MDKKLLVSLMMTAPVAAMASQANWVTSGGNLDYTIKPELSEEGWIPTGLSVDPETSTTTPSSVVNGVLECQVSAGVLTHKAQLVAGKYTFNLPAINNAILKYTVNGAEFYCAEQDEETGKYLTNAVDKDGKPKQFTTDPKEMIPLDEGTAVKIKVNYTLELSTTVFELVPVVNDVKVSVAALTLALDYNFRNALNSLEEEYKEVVETIQSVNADDKNQAAVDLGKEKTQLLTDGKTKIETPLANLKKYAGLDGSAADAGKLAQAYHQYYLNFWDANPEDAADAISNEIAALEGKIKTYNDKVETENGIFANQQQRDQLLIAANDLESAYYAQLGVFVKEQMPAGATADEKKYAEFITNYLKVNVPEEIKKFREAIADQYANPGKEPVDFKCGYTFIKNGSQIVDAEGNPVVTYITEASIRADIAAISYAQAVADWKAYKQFLQDIASVQTVDDEVYGQISTVVTYLQDQKKLVLDKGYETLYEDAIGAARTKLAKYYNANGQDVDFDNDGEIDTKISYLINPAGGLVTDNQNIQGASLVDKAKSAQTIADRKTAMQNVYANPYFAPATNMAADYTPANSESLVGLILNQQEQWAYAKTEIANLKAELQGMKDVKDSETFKTLTAAQQTAINAAITAMETAIGNLETEAKDEYVAHELTANPAAGEYKTKLGKVSEARNQYTNATKDIPGYDLLNGYVEAKQYVLTQTTTANPTIEKYGLSKKFDSSFKEIDKAINEYRANPTDSGKQNIEDALKGVKAACDQLVSAFKAADAELTAANTALTTFDGLLKNKKIVTVEENGKEKKAYDVSKFVYKYTGSDGKEASLTYTSAKNAVDAFQTSLNNIANPSKADDPNRDPQIALDAAKTLSGQITAADYAKYVKDATVRFDKDVTNANLALVTSVKNAIEQKSSADASNKYANVPGMEAIRKVNLTAANTQYGTVSTAVAADASLTSTAYDTKKLAKDDTDLQNVANAYQATYTQLCKVVANADAFWDLTAGPGNPNVPGVQAKITGFSNEINSLTVEPAASYYKTVEVVRLQGLLDAQYKVAGTTQSGAIWKEYQAITAGENKANLQAALTAILSDVTSTKTACIENQTAFTNQVDLSNQVGQLAKNIKDYIEANDDVPANKKKYLDQIEEITTALGQLDAQLTESFGKGKSKVDNPGYEETMNGWLEQLKQISDAEDGGYRTAVEEANKQFITDNKLAASDLDKAYKDAVDYVNDYIYKIDNAGYYSQLMNNDEFKQNHQKLQECYKAIAEYQTNLTNFLADLTSGADRDKWTVLKNSDKNVGGLLNDSESDFDVIATYNDIAETIKNLKDAIDNYAQWTAEWYYKNNLALVANVFEQRTNEWNDEDPDANDNYIGFENVYKLLVDVAGFSTSVQKEDGFVKRNNEYAAAIKDQMTVKANAETAYADADALLKKGKVHEYILAVSGVMNILDEDVNPINSVGEWQYCRNFAENAVNSLWNLNYNYVVDQVEDYISVIEKQIAEEGSWFNYQKPNDEGSLDWLGVSLYEVKTTLEGYLEDLNNIGEQWDDKYYWDTQRLCEIFHNLYSGYSDTDTSVINIWMKVLTNTYEVVEAIQIDGKYNQVVNSLIGNVDSPYNAAMKDLNDLIEFSGYHPNQFNYPINPLKWDIENVKNHINYPYWYNETKKDIVDNADTFKEDFEALQEQIQEAYAAVYQGEVDYANELVFKAKSAFNTANKAGADTKTLDAWNTLIEQYQEDWLELPAYPDEDSDYTVDEAKATVLEFEAKICDLIVEIEKVSVEKGYLKADDQVLAKAQNGYKTQYDAVSSALNTLKDNLAAGVEEYVPYGEQVAEKFSGQIEAEEGKLTGVNTEYNGADNFLIALADKLAYELGQISDDVKDIEPKLDNALKEAERYCISDQAYNRLYAEYLTIITNVNFAHSQQLEYNKNEDGEGVDINQYQYNNIQNWLNGWEYENDDKETVHVEGALERLDQRREEHSLNEDSEIEQWYVTNYYEPYMRNALFNASGFASRDAMNAISEYQDLILDPNKHDVNEEGWRYDYVHAGEIYQQLQDEWDALYPIRYNEDGYRDPIMYLPDPEDPDAVIATTPEEARSAYDEILATINSIKATVAEIKAKAEAEKVIRGDVNLDGDVNITDVQELINIIGTGVQLDDPKKFNSADVAVNDVLNVSDVTALINKILRETNVLPEEEEAQARVRQFMGATSGNNTYRVEEVVGENGLRRFAVLLTNEVTFTAGQLDIMLPAYARVADVSLGERAEELDAYVFENDGYTRVVMTALDNAFISGNNGCVLFIDIEGNAEVSVENVIFSDVNANDYEVTQFGTTGVSDIYDSIKNGVKAIYNAAGQKLNNLTKGVNIIRNADGTVTKKVGK